MLNLLADLQDEHGMAHVFVDLDLAVAPRISDRITMMHQADVVETRPVDDFYHEPIHPYTRAMLGAVLTTDVDAPRSDPT